MGQAGEAVAAHQVALGALLDGRSDVVQAHRALQQGQQAGGVHQPQLQVGLLHQDRVHPVCCWFSSNFLSILVKILKWKQKMRPVFCVLLCDLTKNLSSFTSFQTFNKDF